MSMKSSRLASEAAQSAKLRRLGAQGSTKLATQAEHAMRKYANGGIVGDDEEDELEGMGSDVEGDDPMPRLDRPSRGGKKDKKAGTNVNVIIMPPAAAGAGAPVVPPVAAGPMPPPPPMAGPPPGPMAGGPPMMPPGAGGPPMRKHGGGVNAYANGGKVKKADGGSVDRFMDAAKDGAALGGMGAAGKMMRGAAESGAFKDFVKRAGQGAGEAMNRVRNVAPSMGRKDGGSVKAKHDDEAEDKKLVKGMVKGGCLK